MNGLSGIERENKRMKERERERREGERRGREGVRERGREGGSVTRVCEKDTRVILVRPQMFHCFEKPKR